MISIERLKEIFDEIKFALGEDKVETSLGNIITRKTYLSRDDIDNLFIALIDESEETESCNGSAISTDNLVKFYNKLSCSLGDIETSNENGYSFITESYIDLARLYSVYYSLLALADFRIDVDKDSIKISEKIVKSAKEDEVKNSIWTNYVKRLDEEKAMNDTLANMNKIDDWREAIKNYSGNNFIKEVIKDL